MAIMRPGGTSKRRMSLRGAVLIRVSHGRTYAQAWPRKRGTPQQPYQRANNRRMKVMQRMVRRIPAPERATMEEGLNEFLRNHRGVRGTAAIRLRDWLTQVISGRSWAVSTPDGQIFWPDTVVRDVSDFLDWLEPRYGSLVTRTAEGWLPTVQCSPGHVLCQLPSGQWPGACRPASIPAKQNAMGGYD